MTVREETQTIERLTLSPYAALSEQSFGRRTPEPEDDLRTCYREGRTGDRFMSLVKTGQIANCCAPNALMTLQEYLEDYASPETRELGVQMIREQMEQIPNPAIRRRALENLERIAEGKRDFRF